jgi:hypothetical protein
MNRVRAGISYGLSETMDEEHCGLPRNELEKLAETLLEVPGDLVRAALNLELTDGTMVADSVGDTACVFPAGLHHAERAIAERLASIATATPPPDLHHFAKTRMQPVGDTGFSRLLVGSMSPFRAKLGSRECRRSAPANGLQNYGAGCAASSDRRRAPPAQRRGDASAPNE